MADPHFQSVPLDTIRSHNIPSGMHYAFSFKNVSMPMQFEERVFQEVVAWCEENFAEQYPCEPPRWSEDRHYFFRIFVRGATDAAAFKLRWC